MKKVILLAGQPNCGKSSIFNMLTGAKQHIANYPGITVEKKVGYYKYKNEEVEVVDLPGTYSLSSFTQEEVVARESILGDERSLVLNVVDSSNLERNLYLTFQLLEMNAPTLLTLNMIDIVRSRGYELDLQILEEELGIRALEVSAKKNLGKKELYDFVHENKAKENNFILEYGDLEESIKKISLIVEKHYKLKYPSRWIAIKALELDDKILELLSENSFYFEEIKQIIEYAKANNSAPPNQIIAQVRYEKAENLVNKAIKGIKDDKETISQKVDKVLCHKIFGPLILIFTLYLFFQAVLGTDAYIQPKWQMIIGTIRSYILNLLPVESLINDGTIKTLVGYNMINGAFSLLSYIPMFLILFTLVGIMEDSGYMARIAFMLDKLLKAFGLHGQAVLPLLLGGVGMGGCAIPGIMATRGMKDERAKLITRLIVPILNCGAKIPFYLMIVAAFFRENAALILMIFYAMMFLIVLIIAKIFDTFLGEGEKAPFILEMPEYHMPNMFMVIRESINKVKSFVSKIATVIIPFMAVMWVITYLPGLPKEKLQYFNTEYQIIYNEFKEQVGESNPYLEVFMVEENKINFNNYTGTLRNKMRRIREKESREIKKIDNEFKNKNIVYFEAMALDDMSLINDDEIEAFETYMADFDKKVLPINQLALDAYDRLSKEELAKNPEFYKMATRGNFSLNDDSIKELREYEQNYFKNIKNIDESKLEEFKKQYMEKNLIYFNIVKDGNIRIRGNSIIDNNARSIEGLYQNLLLARANELKEERKAYLVENSIGGRFGKLLEPFTKLAGFDWRVNLAFISTFAAKENFVAVINGIFGISIDETGQLIGAPWTVLNGICLMIALALFPPCIPTLVLVKTETKKVKWMLFVTIYPIILGYMMAILVYQIGTLLGIA